MRGVAPVQRSVNRGRNAVFQPTYLMIYSNKLEVVKDRRYPPKIEYLDESGVIIDTWNIPSGKVLYV